MKNSAGLRQTILAAFMGVATSALIGSAVCAAAAPIKSIRVEGNKRIEKETILSRAQLESGRVYSNDDLNDALKKLFASGLFNDAHVRIDGQTLVVQVVENPIVNRVAIEGNDKISDEILRAELKLRPRQVYSLTVLRLDTQRIQDLYRLKGYFGAVVTPKIVKRDQNRVDVVFEVKEGSATVVRKIFFLGNKRFSNSKLETTIQTKETRWYRFFTTDDNYDPERLAYDRELLRKFYLEHGYVDFQIRSAVAELTSDQSEFYITFTLDEGMRYKVGAVTIESQVPKVDPKTLQKHLTLGQGDWYNSKNIETSIQKLTDALGTLGYAFVDIQPVIKKNAAGQVVDLTFVIKEGPKAYIGAIKIKGNDRTDDEVIRREMRLYETDAFSSNKLKESEKRVKDLGYFKKVSITKEPAGAPDKVDLMVDVEEDRTGELSFGAGWSTSDGPIGNLKFAEHNFRGKGQDLRAGVTYAQHRQEFDVGFTEPYFLDRDLIAGIDLYRITRNRYLESSYDQEIHGTTLHLGYNLMDHLSQMLSYTLRGDKVGGIRSDASRFVQEQKGTSIMSAVGQDLLYDRRDSRIDPTEGYSLGLGNEFAGVGGNIQYLKNRITGSYFYPVMDQVVFELTARYGVMFGLGKKTRIADRYILGGDSLRGFESGGVGPRDRVSKDSLGGKQFYSGTAEVTFPIGLPNEFGVKGAAFSEVGSVWQSGESGPTVFDSPVMRVSGGLGLRWRSPLGPLRIDVAKTFKKNALDETRPILFGFSTRF